MSFEKQLIEGYRLTTIEVVYYMPDYSHILNEFIWQTMDLPPKFCRVHKFLNHWKDNIDAVIKEVNVAYKPEIYDDSFKRVDFSGILQ